MEFAQIFFGYAIIAAVFGAISQICPIRSNGSAYQRISSAGVFAFCLPPIFSFLHHDVHRTADEFFRFRFCITAFAETVDGCLIACSDTAVCACFKIAAVYFSDEFRLFCQYLCAPKRVVQVAAHPFQFCCHGAVCHHDACLFQNFFQCISFHATHLVDDLFISQCHFFNFIHMNLFFGTMGHAIFPGTKVYHRNAVKVHEAPFAPASHNSQFHIFSQCFGSRLPDTQESCTFSVCADIVPFAGFRDFRGEISIFCLTCRSQFLQFLQKQF